MCIPAIEHAGVALLVMPELWRVSRAALHIRTATAPSTTTSRPISTAAVPAKAAPHPSSPFVPVSPLLLTTTPSLPARQPGLETLLAFHRRSYGRRSDTGRSAGRLAVFPHSSKQRGGTEERVEAIDARLQSSGSRRLIGSRLRSKSP